MKPASEKDQHRALQEALAPLREPAAAKKCWACGCFHDLLETIKRAFPKEQLPTELNDAVNPETRH
jgi:hypothetical protein